jgi:hypothetical protein
VWQEAQRNSWPIGKDLGYLTIHTRHIDMVMTDAMERQFSTDTIIHEIEEMLRNDP